MQVQQKQNTNSRDLEKAREAACAGDLDAFRLYVSGRKAAGAFEARCGFALVLFLLSFRAKRPTHAVYCLTLQTFIETLLFAANSGHETAISTLLDADEGFMGQFARATVERCIEVDSGACLKLLLDRGFRFGAAEGSGFVRAAQAGSLSCLIQLTESLGVDALCAATHAEFNGRTPLIAACENNRA